ncbi:Helix-turn-helix [Sinosporangium album]|uniref:Helix-turn-helix n=2 Tax=Sinosporangium album TaxID=504805 RepID=A0A1G7T144_9ACTN|nr:Helix-turn-helix [Sinosporangium album]
MGIGRRIAQARKLRGLTQQQLADRVPCSKSLIAQVERGHKPATQALVAAVARTLGVGLGRLTGQPYHEGREEQVHCGIPEIRRALLSWDLPDEDLLPPPLEQLRLDVRCASDLGRRAQFAQLTAMLPGLLEELTRAAHFSDGSPCDEVFGLLAEAYTGVTAIAYTFGYFDLRSLAMDRVMWAAHSSQDRLRVARTYWQRSTLFLATAAYDKGLSLLDRVRQEIGEDLGRLNAAELSVLGAAHLRSAIFAARAADRQTAFEHVEHAREAARVIGRDANHYGLEFGPSNVAMHAVAVAVEMCDGGEAIRLAGSSDFPATVAPVRLGHYYIDVARGWLYHGDRQKSFDMLLAARRTAPQQTRNHPMVHETVRAISTLKRRRSRELSDFARWLGLP